ncbi:MAG: hypothetical protein IJ468_00695 [Lachnospiraceae bacterium]|nr:hypothetical protein [Lachnospiraceae bacterium]
MKKILAVYDADEEYGKRLSEYLNRKDSIPFSMVCFTRQEALAEYCKTHTIDMLLLSESSMTKEISELPVRKIVYLTDVQKVSPEADGHYVYRFQSSDHVIRELMTCYETMDMQVMETIAALHPVQIAAVFSPVSRCLKTSFALTLAQVLSRTKQVLYLNFEEFSGLEALFGRIFSSDLSDALFYHAQGLLKGQLANLTESWHNMDYIPPVRYPEDLFDMKTEQVTGLVQELARVCHYDVIVLDYGSSIRFAAEQFPICQKIYMPVKEDPVSQGKIESFESWMKMKNKMDQLARIEKLKLPFYRPFGSGEMYLEQMLWGELGDYVRTLVKGEW